jgi:hypothetical protein
MYVCIYRSVDLSNLSIHLSTYLSICLTVYLSLLQVSQRGHLLHRRLRRARLGLRHGLQRDAGREPHLCRVRGREGEGEGEGERVGFGFGFGFGLGLG